MNERAKGNLLTYLNENEFNKKIRALKKYCMRSYKDLVFNIVPKLKSTELENGLYKKPLKTDKMFKCVYGEIQIVFYVNNGVIILEDLIPSDVLIDMYRKDLKCYKGVPVRNKKDIFKIKLIEIRSLDKGKEV